MKHSFTLSLAILLSVCATAQDSLRFVATNLENISYPFPVKYIHLTVQDEPVQLLIWMYNRKRQMAKQ